MRNKCPWMLQMQQIHIYCILLSLQFWMTSMLHSSPQVPSRFSNNCTAVIDILLEECKPAHSSSIFCGIWWVFLISIQDMQCWQDYLGPFVSITHLITSPQTNSIHRKWYYKQTIDCRSNSWYSKVKISWNKIICRGSYSANISLDRGKSDGISLTRRDKRREEL